MDFKKEMKNRGLKMIWVAEQIQCNYASFKVYINNTKLMPEWVDERLRQFLN